MINYNQDITSKDIDLDFYELKFKLILDYERCTDDKIKRSLLKRILNDKTLFSNKLFIMNNNPVKLYAWQDLCLSDPHRFTYLLCGNQTGKEQPYSSLILTEKGYVTMGSLKVGDYVFGSDGNKCQIKSIHEQGIKPVYKLTFSDGSIAECGLNHLWKVQTPRNRFKSNFKGKYPKWSNSKYGKWEVLSLKNLIENYGYNPIPPNRCIIPVCDPVNFEKKELPIHPYIVGVMLGDGTMSHGFGSQITSADEEIISKISEFLPEGLTIKKCNDKYHYSINSNHKQIWSKLFKKCGFINTKSENKFIPDDYLFSSSEDRLLLLKGLMDTDGTIDDMSCVEFYSKSIKLADGVKFLVNSLGGKCKIVLKKAYYKNKNGDIIDCGICYRVKIYMNSINPFYLPRKANKHYKTRYREDRVLRSIEFVRHENSRCLLVDSPDNTYLTNECIVTHNSIVLDIDEARNLIIDHGFGHNAAIISSSLDLSKFQMRRIRELISTMPRIDISEDTTEENKTTFIVRIKDDTGKIKYSNLLLCAPCTVGAVSYDLHSLNLDEFEFWERDQKEFYEQVALARTFHTRGKVRISSNPNGCNNYGDYLQHLCDLKGNRVYHTYNFNFLDIPGHTQEEWNEFKHQMSRAKFESCVAAIRSISDKNFFSQEEIDRSRDNFLSEVSMMNKQPFFFLDVGAKHDQSVLVCGYKIYKKEGEEDIPHIYVPIIHVYPVGYPISRVVGSYDKEQDCDGWHYEKSVKEYLDEWSENGIIPMFGCDVTGNSGISPLFASLGINPEDVVMSGPAKSGMYQRFKWYMEKGLLHRIPKSEFEYQASHLMIKKRGRYLQIHHETEDDLDDCMDSMAGLIYMIDPEDSYPASIKRF